jgi:AcrR family transcriptional regulator
VFEERGYVATTVGLITQRAATAHGTFYLHFRNKQDAFERVMAQVADDLYRESNVPHGDDPFEVLEASIRGYLRVYGQHRGLWRCLLEGLHQNAGVEDLWVRLRRPFFERVERNLEHLAACGQGRAVEPRLTAHALGSMVEWAAFCHVELNQPGGDVTLDELAHALSDLWFHAVYRT